MAKDVELRITTPEPEPVGEPSIVAIVLAAKPGETSKVEVDGDDISHAITALHVRATPRGGCTVTVAMAQVGHLLQGPARVRVDERTHKALITLGWTPPASHQCESECGLPHVEEGRDDTTRYSTAAQPRAYPAGTRPPGLYASPDPAACQGPGADCGCPDCTDPRLAPKWSQTLTASGADADAARVRGWRVLRTFDAATPDVPVWADEETST